MRRVEMREGKKDVDINACKRLSKDSDAEAVLHVEYQ